jgi:hypothetical protein
LNRTVICAILIFTTLSLVFSGSSSSTSSSSNAYAQSTTTSIPSIFVLGSEDKSSVVEIDLRAVQQGAQITQLKTFDITIDNVVQIKQGGSIKAFSGDPSLKIVKAKVRTDTEIENLRELPRTQGNTFSLTGLASGVYILDIIAQKDNRDLAYETILVILDRGEPTTITANLQIINNIITKVKTEVKNENKNIIKIIRGNGGSSDGGGKPTSHPKSCPEGSIWDNVEKICVIVDVEPIPQPPTPQLPTGVFKPDEDCRYNPDQEKCTLPDPTKDCPPGFARNEDAQCFKEGDCPEGYARGDEDESGACYPEDDMVTCPNGDRLSPGWECVGEELIPKEQQEQREPEATTTGDCEAEGNSNEFDEVSVACDPGDPVPLLPEPEAETETEVSIPTVQPPAAVEEPDTFGGKPDLDPTKPGIQQRDEEPGETFTPIEEQEEAS